MTVAETLDPIAAVFVVLGALLALYTLFYELKKDGAKKDIGRICYDKKAMGNFAVDGPHYWLYIFDLLRGKEKKWTRLPRLPTIASLISAGDESLYTSSVFDQIEEVHSEICWKSLYTNLFNELALSSKDKTRESRAKLPDIWAGADKYVKRIKLSEKGRIQKESALQRSLSIFAGTEQGSDVFGEGLGDVARPKSNGAWLLAKRLHQIFAKVTEYFQPTGRVEASGKGPERHFLYRPDGGEIGECGGKRKMLCCIRDLDFYDDSKDKSQHHPKVLTDIQEVWIVDDKPCVEVIREELAGLSIILGIALRIRNNDSLAGEGPFGTYINGKVSDTHRRLQLMHAHRRPEHSPSKGSGYSTLFAKHMACESLPFGKSVSSFMSVHVSDEVLQSVKVGKAITRGITEPSPAGGYLCRLPSARYVDFYGHTEERREANPYGLIKLPRERAPAGGYLPTWARAVTGLAFGGLVPQAGPNLVDAIRFTFSSHFENTKLAELVLKMASLLDEVQTRDHSLNLFGKYRSSQNQQFAEERAYYFVHSPGPGCYSSTRDAGAVFARYMTLLERVTAIYSESKARRKSLQNENQQLNWVSTFLQTQNPTGLMGTDGLPTLLTESATREEVYVNCCKLIENDYYHAVKKELGEKLEDQAGEPKDLVTDAEEIFVMLQNTEVNVDTCAKLARCIIAAWAHQVPLVGLRVHSHDLRHRGEDIRVAEPLHDLPTVSALG